MPDIYRAVWMVLRDKHWLEINKLAIQYLFLLYIYETKDTCGC